MTKVKGEYLHIPVLVFVLVFISNQKSVFKNSIYTITHKIEC